MPSHAYRESAARPHCHLALLLVAMLTPLPAVAQRIDGFTEPYRVVNLAAAESGIIRQLVVREGDRVQSKQVVARLDREVHEARLAIAQERKDARGRVEAAEAQWEMRKHRLGQFEALRAGGYARQEEIDRARAALAIAAGQAKAAREELLILELEHHKILVELERRLTRSPIGGVVTLVHKEVGEFVAPNDPDILTVVQLNPLLAVFSLASQQARRFRVGQKVEVTLGAARVKGPIEFIAPVTHAESGTVRVKVRIKNDDGLYRSGERCWITLPEAQ